MARSMISPARDLRVRLLGDIQLEGCAALGRRQPRTLLKILALNQGHPVAVDHLADCLWGDEQPARAADQISVLVSRLRGVVGAAHRVHDALAADGTWLVVEPYANGTVTENLNPVGRVFYGAPTGICTPSGLTGDGLASATRYRTRPGKSCSARRGSRRFGEQPRLPSTGSSNCGGSRRQW